MKYLIFATISFLISNTSLAAFYVKDPSARNQVRINATISKATQLLKNALKSTPKPGTRAALYKQKYNSFWISFLEQIDSINYKEALEPEKDCKNAVANAAEDFNQITFCPGFYEYGDEFMVHTLLHELAHMSNIESAAPGVAGVDDEECLAEQAAYGVLLLNGLGPSYTWTYECKK